MSSAKPGQALRPGVYGQGINSVRIDQGGKITVKPGDSISKYALALYGNARAGWDDFGKMVGNLPKRLEDVNLIRVGEKLVHLPTFNANSTTSSHSQQPKAFGGLEAKRPEIEKLIREIELKSGVVAANELNQFFQDVGNDMFLVSQIINVSSELTSLGMTTVTMLYWYWELMKAFGLPPRDILLGLRYFLQRKEQLRVLLKDKSKLLINAGKVGRVFQTASTTALFLNVLGASMEGKAALERGEYGHAYGIAVKTAVGIGVPFLGIINGVQELVSAHGPESLKTSQFWRVARLFDIAAIQGAGIDAAISIVQVICVSKGRQERLRALENRLANSPLEVFVELSQANSDASAQRIAERFNKMSEQELKKVLSSDGRIFLEWIKHNITGFGTSPAHRHRGGNWGDGFSR